MLRFVRFAALPLVTFALGCGGGQPEPTATAETTTPSGGTSGGDTSNAPEGSGTRDEPYQLCHDNGGPDRTDYPFVASYACADGSTPLGGSARRGAQARVGNVGPGPDGHVVDLYRIPCPSGPVEVYVDAYHCGAGVQTEVDPNHLNPQQLANMAAMIRGLHRDPFSQRAHGLRRELLVFVMQSPQVGVVVCEPVAAMLPTDTEVPYLPEFTISLAASVIEDGGDPADPVRVNLAALHGVLLYYDAIVRQQGDAARNPQMDDLMRAAQDGSLELRVQQAVSGCDTSGMGVHQVP